MKDDDVIDLAKVVDKPTSQADDKLRPPVNNHTRIIVGFPFSSVRVQESSEDLEELAGLLARLCRRLADDAADGDELTALAGSAEELAERLQDR